MGSSNEITAIILAAGESKRMHFCKIVLPWEGDTIISHIISVLKETGIDEIVVVTGGYRELVEPEVTKSRARSVYNPDYHNDEMIISLNVGLSTVDFERFSGFFFALGDQPMIFADDLRKLMDKHRAEPEKIIIPSYNLRRGHPWLIPTRYVEELKQLRPPETLRAFLKRHEIEIEYVLVDNPGILGDIDTPEEYQRNKPI
jgi:molybdenum cofactor cytidylyltransferase